MNQIHRYLITDWQMLDTVELWLFDQGDVISRARKQARLIFGVRVIRVGGEVAYHDINSRWIPSNIVELLPAPVFSIMRCGG